MTHSDSTFLHGFVIGFSGLPQQARVSPNFIYIYRYQLHSPRLVQIGFQGSSDCMVLAMASC